jgi:hypothetical protein
MTLTEIGTSNGFTRRANWVALKARWRIRRFGPSRGGAMTSRNAPMARRIETPDGNKQRLRNGQRLRAEQDAAIQVCALPRDRQEQVFQQERQDRDELTLF